MVKCCKCKKKADVTNDDGLTPYCFGCYNRSKLTISGIKDCLAKMPDKPYINPEEKLLATSTKA